MNIFIDTAVKGCGIAVFDNQGLFSYVQEPIERGHAETLLPMIQKLISDVNKTTQDIENIFVTIGPGSFTGLRVCLTAAQFMGYSLNKPTHGITTFQAFSSFVLNDVPRLVLVETKRDDYYVQMMDANHRPLNDASNITADKIVEILSDYSDAIITGDAVNRFVAETGWGDNDTINQEMINPQSVINALLAGHLSHHKAEAFYIRDADVTMPKTA